MNIKKHSFIVFIFLLTLFFNNLFCITIENKLIENDDDSDILKDEIKQFAKDSIKVDISGKKAKLYGDAKITYQDITITAAVIEINWERSTIHAQHNVDSINQKIGKPVFKEKNESFEADEITYNFKTKKCRINNIITSEGEGYILGETVKKVDNKSFFILNGDYTTCDAEKPHFSIRSKKIKVVPGEKIVTGPAFLSFFKIPTPIFLPFSYLPNNSKKSSGILVPSYGESANMGFFLKELGYYFTINDQLDLTLKSDIYTQGSWNLKSLFRYKKRYKYSGDLNLNFGSFKSSYKGFPDYSKKQDFNIKWAHKQDPKANPSFRFSANIEAGSSTYHRNNSYDANDYLKNTMSSNINISKTYTNSFINNLNISFRHSQNISNKTISLTIPNVSINSKRISPFKKLGNPNKKNWFDKIYFQYTLNSKNSITTADSLLFSRKSLAKFRNGVSHNIPISSTFRFLKHFNLTTNFNLTERWYTNQINKTWNNNTSEIIIDTINKFTRGHDYSFSSGLNTKIYGLLKFKNSKLAAIRHVITPSLSFRFQPDFSDEKYGFYKTVQINNQGDIAKYSIMQNGIYGSPSSFKSGNINLNIGNLVDMKVKSIKDTSENFKKINIVESLNIGTSYNIFSDSLNFSNLRLNARTRLLDIFDITFNGNYDLYVTNNEKNNNLNKFEILTNNRLARLKNFTTSFGIRINESTFKKEEDSEKERLKWNFRSDYTLNYNKGFNTSRYADTIQSLNFSGSFNLNKKWKLGFRSGYDFESKEISYTSIDIYRDLHCWELLFNWIPIGYHQSYTITLRVKAASLRDLKYEKKKQWFVPDYN